MGQSSGGEAFDVVVVGCGLAGLAAGLRLQRAGHRVLILERRGVPGGLCGTHLLDGYEFVIACNDFGLGMEREMRELGVAASFYRPRTRFHFDHGVFDVPPMPSTLLRLLPRVGDIARFVWALRRAGDLDLGTLVERSVRSRSFADLIDSLAYPLGVPPYDLPIENLKVEFSRDYGYGYHRPTAPVGGPAALVTRMLERFLALGGSLELENECLEIRRDERRGATGKVVVASRGSHAAREVVSSHGRWGDYPEDCKPGLAVSMFHLAVDRALPYPEGVHTMVHLPSGVGRWMSQIDCGEWPEAFGFHAFRSQLARRPDHYTMNVYAYLPRGVERPNRREIQRVEGYVFERLDAMLPRLASALIYKRFVSPAEFVELHGLSSRVVQLRLKPGFRKPEIYDPEREVYHVGNSVLPPGEHAGAAVLSGRMAAEAVMQALSRPSGDRRPSSPGTPLHA